MGLKLGEIANIITDCVTMYDVCDVYGLEVRRNFISCPFHNENTASLHIDNKFWHCFGCGEGGNLIQFVEKLFNLDFKDTVIKLDNDFGLYLTQSEISEQTKRKAEELRARREKEQKEKDEKERYIQKAKEDYLTAWKYYLIYAPYPETPNWDINTDPYVVDQYLKHVDKRYLQAISELNKLSEIAEIYDFKIERWEAERMFLK